MNTWEIVFLACGIVLLLIAIQCVLGYITCNYMFGKKPYSYESAFEREIAKGNVDKNFCKKFVSKEFLINSDSGYHIYGRYFLQSESTNKTAVIMHGHAGNIMWAYKYVKIFQDMGYNWVVFDNRGCGKSGGKKYTMGKAEAVDLVCVVDFAKSLVENAQIVVHGESLGASTAILALEKTKDIKCVVADCGFSSLKEEAKYQLQKHKMPWHFVGALGSLITKIRLGFFLADISPLEVLKSGKVKTPILFVHGTEDKKTPAKMCQEMFDVYTGEKEIYLCEGAAHAKAFVQDKEKYKKVVEDFCDKFM